VPSSGADRFEGLVFGLCWYFGRSRIKSLLCQTTGFQDITQYYTRIAVPSTKNYWCFVQDSGANVNIRLFNIRLFFEATITLQNSTLSPANLAAAGVVSAAITGTKVLDSTTEVS
jgi:hypothetical protein